jgi:hypothetical protein
MEALQKRDAKSRKKSRTPKRKTAKVLFRLGNLVFAYFPGGQGVVGSNPATPTIRPRTCPQSPVIGLNRSLHIRNTEAAFARARRPDFRSGRQGSSGGFAVEGSPLLRAGAMAAQIKRAGRPQHRCEVRNLAVDLDRLVVKFLDEFGRRQVVAFGYFFEKCPERSFQLDAGRMPSNADGAVDLAITFRVLTGKNHTHF